MRGRTFSLSVVILLVLSFAVLLEAQEYRGRITGTVADSSRAAVPDAKVTLRNINTGVEMVKTTDATGIYLFDYVLPGMYTVTAEAIGFNKTVQENVEMLTHGDVTVNVTLLVGSVAVVMTVTAEPPSLETTTSTMSETVRGTMLEQIPVLSRNPFSLALLDPAVANEYWDVEHRNPFYMWASNGVDVGGDTAGHNDLLLDGVPLGVASRGSYMPSMDAVQEVNVMQNSVDAEFGFSAGGTLNVSIKSGTNKYHGSAYYFGRNPMFNALSDSVTKSPNPVHNHIWGGTVGGPIKKNTLFTFVAYEGWKTTQPSTKIETLPTDAEKQGDFSQALTPDGTLRVIYDPMTTVFDPITQTVTRQPFPGNIIPQNRIDPTGSRLVNDLWRPNNPGSDLTGVNNFQLTYGWWMKYWNLLDRTDYNINSKWRVYGRYSQFITSLDNPNYGHTIAVPSDDGGIMKALNVGGDALYQWSANTTLDFRVGFTKVEDDYDSSWAKVGKQEYQKLWPNNDWYSPVLATLGDNIYYPNLNFSGNGGQTQAGDVSGWWQTHERQLSYQFGIAHDQGINHLKMGQSLRYDWDHNLNTTPVAFNFDATDTASTFLGPDLTLSGDPFATALLGGVSSGTASINFPLSIHRIQTAAFVQDDLKVSHRLTLNMGLRYEFETAPVEASNQFSRYLDLAQPIPEFQSNPVNIPSSISQYVAGGYKFNGAWKFTDSAHRGLYNANHHIFLPRLGAAYRLGEKTALRAGWARYVTPVVSMLPEGAGISIYGYSRGTSTAPVLAGIPQGFISDPFPLSNPMQLPTGKSLGSYQNLGDGPSWIWQNLNPPVNDRISFSVQRQLPFGIALDGSYYLSFGRNVIPTGPGQMWGQGGHKRNLDMMDPNLAYNTLQGLVDQPVANPFYNYGTADTFPGWLRYQPQVSMRQLLQPYPQYTDFSEQFIPGFHTHYSAFQLHAERKFANGLGLSFGYNYNHQNTQNWFNDLAQYADIAQNPSGQVRVSHTRWFPDTWPRSRITTAGTWIVPVGRGQKYLSHMPAVLNAVVGGWETSHILYWHSGDQLRFDEAIAPTSTPKVYRRRDQWFDTSGFNIPLPYTPRTNPWQYSGLYGPNGWDLDSTLVKYFKLREGVKLEFRMEFYNLPNCFVPNDPDLAVGDSTFGQTTDQLNSGRQIQYTARIQF